MAPTLETISVNCSTSMQAPPPWSFQGMLDGVEAAFRRQDCKVDVDEVWRALEGYKSNSSDWSKYAFYDETKFKRNLVAEYDKYNVMLLCWAPGASSSIHNHAGAHCFMKTLEGELLETRYAWPDEDLINSQDDNGQEMEMISQKSMRENVVLYINDKVGLHRVENPSKTKSATSLHVYIPPYKKCKAFDPKTGRARECQLTFFSEMGTIIGKDEVNPWSKP